MEDDNHILIQKKLFGTTIYYIEYDNVFVHHKKIFSEEKYKIYFDKLNPEAIEIKNFPKLWSSLTIIFGLWVLHLFTQLIFYGGNYLNIIIILIPSIFSSYMFILKYNTYIFFNSSPYNLLFFKDKPSEKEFSGFIDLLIQKQKEYFLRNRVPGDDTIALDELERLSHLKNIKALTKDEFEELKKQLLERQKLKGKFFSDSSVN